LKLFKKSRKEILRNRNISITFSSIVKVEHEGDDWTETDWNLLETDLFGYSVRSWSLRIDHVKGNLIYPLAIAFADNV